MQSIFDLHDRVIAVAGAAGAFGSVISGELVNLGRRVAMFDRNEDNLHELASRFDANSVIEEFFDVTEEAACESALQNAREKWGRLDGFVNCVGLFEIAAATRMSEKIFARIIGTNLNAAFVLCRTAATVMIPQNYGRSNAITVNAISPAICDTSLTHSFLEQGVNRDLARSRIPLGRLFEPRDLLGTVILLLSQAGLLITGQAIHVDCGRTIS